jgi:predicted metal-dependent peptidase
VDDRGRSDSEINRIRKQVAKAIQDQATSDGIGSIPGSWKIWADKELEPPKVRWEDAVQRLCRSTYQHRRGLVTYRYDRPSRRQAVFGYGPGVPVIPRMTKPIPRVVFIADTSGSMGGMGPRGRLRPVMSEVKGLFDALGVEMTFGVCDAAMQDIKQVTSIEECLDLLSGGGGTSFVPIFEAVQKMRPKPDLLIIGTDAFGPAPKDPPPNMSTIWLVVNEQENVRPTVDGVGTPINWGHFIYINPNDLKTKKAA